MRIQGIVTIWLLLFVANSRAATSLNVGMRVPAITLTDQHDVEGSLWPDTRCIIFDRDMASAKIVQAALADNPTLLDAAGAVVVSDISRMPRLITKLFALPAMRKRPYRTLLDRDGKVTADLPFEKGKVTVLFLKDLTIEHVEYIDSADALRTVLRQAAEPPTPEHRSGGDAQ